MVKLLPTQRQLSEFVANHVSVCQTTLVEELLRRGMCSCEDIVNLTSEEDEDEPNEIYEWWLVDPWLLRKLEQHHQPILCTEYGSWWGRTCTGQSIALDDVIAEIYSNLPNL